MLAQFLCISTTEHTLKAPASNAANKVTVSTNYHMKKQQEVSINNDVMVFMIEWLKKQIGPQRWTPTLLDQDGELYRVAKEVLRKLRGTQEGHIMVKHWNEEVKAAIKEKKLLFNIGKMYE